MQRKTFNRFILAASAAATLGLGSANAQVQTEISFFYRETSLPVHVADDPLTAVARGTGRVLEDLDAFSSVLIKSKRY